MKFLCFAVILAIASNLYASEATPQELFDQRIMPIFRSENPSSCVQCHLSSVDLKQYILPSQEQTFVSLRDQGLIDIEDPSESKILKLIRMGDKDLDEGAKLIHEKTRQAEYEAFSAWVKACCADSNLRDLPKGTLFAKPNVPDGVIRHARKSRVVDSFARNVWSQRMRCFPCHTPHEIDPENPKHQAAVKKQKEMAEQYGQEMMERMNLFRASPEESLRYLIENSRNTAADRLPLINLDEPANSLIVLKPTSKLPKQISKGKFEEPSYTTPVSHMGGLKMHLHDHSYKSFVRWIEDYARVVNGDYKSVDELPGDNWYASQFILRVKSVPEDWDVGSVVQMFVYEWDSAADSWADEPIAFTQGTVTPRRFANGALFLLGHDQARAQSWREKVSLPRGRYLAKLFVDKEGKVQDDPSHILGGESFVGQAEIPKARWRAGFKFAEVVDATGLSE